MDSIFLHCQILKNIFDHLKNILRPFQKISKFAWEIFPNVDRESEPPIDIF